MPHKPSVLWITLDALRADHLSCYGYKRNTSPHIDRLAKEGVLFTQAIAQDTWTVPAMASLLTSTYPPEHGVSYFADTINPSLVTLPEILKENGYGTCFIGPYVISTIKGFNRGFDFFNTGTRKIFENLPTSLFRHFSTFRTMAKFFLKMDNEKAEVITGKAIAWLAAQNNKPFFLWLHYFDAHGPYRPPAPFRKMFLNDGLEPGGNKHLPILWKKVFGLGGIPHHITEKNRIDAAYYISQYDGAIRYVDEEIGHLLKTLEKLKLDENTVIVISADHGTYLGEHNFYFCHTGMPFEPLIRVPLIIKYDKIQNKGKIIDTQVQSIDIASTVLDILNLNRAGSFQGTSLKPLMVGETSFHTPYAFIGDKKCAAVRTKDFKLMRIDDRQIKKFEEMIKFRLRSTFALQLEYLFGHKKWPPYLFFDLTKDPQEANDLAKIESKEVRTFKEALFDFIHRVPFSSSPDKEFLMEPEAEEKLRSLGYLE